MTFTIDVKVNELKCDEMAQW